MTDLIVTGAMALLKPALAAVGKSAWTAVSEGSKKAFEWLTGKFTKSAQEGALKGAVESPDDADALASLEFQIKQALKDETFKSELLALLPKETRDHIEQQATIIGNNNENIQISGTGNSVTR